VAWWSAGAGVRAGSSAWLWLRWAAEALTAAGVQPSHAGAAK
jgi:hypothetical protein